MVLHDIAFQAESDALRLELPACPRCGDQPFLPQVSEFAGEFAIRHSWLCESCGHAFQTTIRLRRREKPRSR